MQAAEMIPWKTMTPTERNRAVTERIMGVSLRCPGEAVTTWRKSPSRIPGEYLEFATWRCPVCNQGESMIAPKEHDACGETPRYSEYLDAAFEMLRHLIGETSETYARARAFFAELG